MLAVRRYEPQDADATIEIFLKAIREVASRDYDHEQIHAWAHVEDPVAWARKRESRPTWVATYDGISAGFSDLEPTSHLDMMFVHPQYQNLGVASLLLRTVEAAAHDRGLRLITTDTSLTARPFFQSRGFTVVSAQEVQKQGRILRNFKMEKRLVEVR